MSDTLNEFKQLVEAASAAHGSSPAFGKDLIIVLAEHGTRIDQLHEDEQRKHREALAAKLCADWGIEPAWLDRVIELYLREADSELGSRMRSLLTEHAVVNLTVVQSTAIA